jgi:hypothetical protein
MFQASRQAKLALGLYARIAVHSDLNNPAVSNIVVNLWQITHKQEKLSKDMLSRFRSLISERKGCQELASQLTLPTFA